MTDSPGLIGSHRLRLRALPLERAIPTIPLRSGQPIEKTEPKSADELRADREWLRDQQPLLTACVFCDWTFAGTVGEGRRAALEHRVVEHSAAAVRVGRGRRGMRWGKSDESDPLVVAARAEQNRVRAEREDADRLAKIERGRQDRGEEPQALLGAEPPTQTAGSLSPRDESGWEAGGMLAAEDAGTGEVGVPPCPDWEEAA